MQQKVQVKRILSDGRAEVFLQRQSACSGDCHKCSGCGAVRQTVCVPAFNPVGAQPGDQVIITSDAKPFYLAVLVVYVLPLLGLVAGYLLGTYWAASPGLLAAAGFSMGIAGVLLYHRRAKRHPVVYTIQAYAQD